MKERLKKGLSALSVMLLAVCMLTPVHAAETASLNESPEQTARLQKLAEEYTAAQQTESAFSISGLTPYMTPERIRRIAAMALDSRTDILADLGIARRSAKE